MRDEITTRRKTREAERRERDRQRGRLGPGRFDRLVMELVTVTRMAFEAGAIGSKFGLEGTMRHAIRGDLCLQGWSWHDADIMARDALAETFKRLRANRPSKEEGQPDWAIAENIILERTRCARCHKPLPEGHHKFCSDLCARASRAYTARIAEAKEATAYEIAMRGGGWI